MQKLHRFLAVLLLSVVSFGVLASGLTSPSYYNQAAVAITGGTMTGMSSIQMGSGATGIVMRPRVGSPLGAIYSTSITPSSSNYSFMTDGQNAYINGTNASRIRVSDSEILVATSTGVAVTGTLSSTGALSSSTTSNAGTGFLLNGVMLFSSTAPTISSGFGAGASISNSNGTATFRINVGTGGASGSGVIALPAAPNGWNCFFADIINATLTSHEQVVGSNTVSVNVTNVLNSTGAQNPWGSGAIVMGACLPY